MVTGLVDRCTYCLVRALAISLLLAPPAVAQYATQAQQDAIRQACPADYQAHCANVPAAGRAAFLCLERNLAGLSPACQHAVRSVGATAPPQGASAPPGVPKSAGTARY
jgi:hypothetical protein